MTDLDYDDTDDGGDEGSEVKYAPVPREQVRTWEKQSKAAQEAEERAATAERRLALLEAGAGSLTERQQKALLASIDGDITADTLREAAVDLGFMQPAKDAAPDAETEALNRMSQASSGATDPNSEDSVARITRVSREGGKDALLAQIQADGHQIVTSG